MILDKKKIVFLTGTRADFGKMKSLISACETSESIEVFVFVTGMHMHSKYGYTAHEVEKMGFKNIFRFISHEDVHHMDRMLAKTIDGFSPYVREIKPDMIVVHGDRLEALAGAIVGSFNNIMVSHIEGGEVSGTIDESIRHSVSKLSHFHFVANEDAKNRLVQMGENKNNIFVIGSPDLDIILNNTTSIDFVKKYYDIEFEQYALSIFHPVTTEFELIKKQSEIYFKALYASKKNYIVIYPNNDYGSDVILNSMKNFLVGKRFKIFPSLRFEFFSILLEHAEFIIGNSSAGVREAPYYPTKTINVGSRQLNRNNSETIINIEPEYDDILGAIDKVKTIKAIKQIPNYSYGKGDSNIAFLEILEAQYIWENSIQKSFYREKYV